MNQNVRTGIVLLCIAGVGAILALGGNEGATATTIGGLVMAVCGVAGLVSVAVGVARPQKN